MKRCAVLLINLLLLSFIAVGQSINVNMSNGTRQVNCSQTINFYDPGGANGNYSNTGGYYIVQKFKAPTGQCLKVTFTAFELADAQWDWDYWGYIAYDYLEIFDGQETNESLLIGDFYYGTYSPGVVFSTSGWLTFRFYSGNSQTYSGWSATITCVDCPLPGEEMHAGTVTLSCPETVNFYDPGGPNADYGNYLDITQTFTTDGLDNCQVQVTFNSFDLECGSSGTFWDWMEIYDGFSDAAPQIGSRYGGNSEYMSDSRPQTITSTSGALTIKFHSDVSNSIGGHYEGWSAIVTCVECSSSPPPDDDDGYTMEDGTITTCSGYFYDPGGPGGSSIDGADGNYGHSLDITQTIVSASPDSCIQVTFTSFELESITYDHLDIYDGMSTSADHIGQFGGTTSPGTVVSSSGALTFVFHSDVSINKSGWEAIITCVECPPPPPPHNPCDPGGINPFCTEDNPYGITYPSGLSGYASEFLGSSPYSCLASAPNPAWYYMQIGSPGNLLLRIEQYSLYNNSLDVDFICWGPFTASSQSDFENKLCNGAYSLDNLYSTAEGTISIPLTSGNDMPGTHCPANGDHSNGNTGGYPVGNVVDCSYSFENIEWCYIPDAQIGQWYLLMITNYSGQYGTITFNSMEGSSTAITNCNLLAPISSNDPCEGDTLVLTCENPQEGATYNWYAPGGGLIATTSEPTVRVPNASASQSGTYTMQITGLDSDVEPASVDVTIHSIPQLVITASPDTVCEGGSVTLSVTGAQTYLWSPTAEEGSAITVSPANSTVYTVTGTDGFCYSTASHLVVVTGTPEVSVTYSADTICEGDTVTLQAVASISQTTAYIVPAVAIGDILCTDNSIVKPSDWPVAGKTAMGIVFYVDSTGAHGWAVHLQEQGTSVYWAPNNYTNIDMLFDYTSARSAIADLDGYTNTLLIREMIDITQYCAAWVVPFNEGWYLPAVGQLRMLYAEIATINISLQTTSSTLLPTSGSFWSSTEYGEPSAWRVFFNSGSVENASKRGTACKVRSVRNF